MYSPKGCIQIDYILSLMALVPSAAGVLFDAGGDTDGTGGVTDGTGGVTDGTGGGGGDSDGDDALSAVAL